MNERLFLSKELKTILDKLPESKTIPVGEFNFDVIESQLFPFEITYDACDLVTRREIKISSGEWIHAAIIPHTDFSELPPLISFYPEEKKDERVYVFNAWEIYG